MGKLPRVKCPDCGREVAYYVHSGSGAGFVLLRHHHDPNRRKTCSCQTMDREAVERLEAIDRDIEAERKRKEEAL